MISNSTWCAAAPAHDLAPGTHTRAGETSLKRLRTILAEVDGADASCRRDAADKRHGSHARPAGPYCPYTGADQSFANTNLLRLRPVRIEEHYTDTAGFTDHVFGLMHLLGFRFAPRGADLQIHQNNKTRPLVHFCQK